MGCGGVTKAKAVLLAPGAGADRDHHTLLALEEALAPVPVRRMDFPYRIAGRRAPDRAPVLEAAVREELDALVAEHTIRPKKAVVLGGRSMGGRICSMVVAAGAPAAGLVLISYPLHPPGKADRLRTEHLPDIEVPALFISGDRDPFGTPAELTKATATIPGPVTHHWIEGGRHDLKGADDEICRVVAEWLRGLPR